MRRLKMLSVVCGSRVARFRCGQRQPEPDHGRHRRGGFELSRGVAADLGFQGARPAGGQERGAAQGRARQARLQGERRPEGPGRPGQGRHLEDRVQGRDGRQGARAHGCDHARVRRSAQRPCLRPQPDRDLGPSRRGRPGQGHEGHARPRHRGRYPGRGARLDGRRQGRAARGRALRRLGRGLHHPSGRPLEPGPAFSRHEACHVRLQGEICARGGFTAQGDQRVAGRAAHFQLRRRPARTPAPGCPHPRDHPQGRRRGQHRSGACAGRVRLPRA